MKVAEDSPEIEPASSTEQSASAEQRWALVERIAASEHFGRSARLRDFLLYVGKRSLKPNSPEIHEQEIGAKVFGRSENYDRSQDNIVRVNASELRKRIEAYFASEGRDEPLRCEIPRGSYKPVFRRNTPQTVLSSADLLPSPLSPETEKINPQPKRTFSARPWLLPAFSLLLALCCVFLLVENQRLKTLLYPWKDKPTVAAFWTGFLNSHQQADLVFPDDSASVIEDITGSPVSLGDYVSRNFVRRVQSLPLSADRQGDALQVYNHNLVTFGAIRAAQMIQKQIPADYPRELVWTRFYTADELKRNNVVLIGGRKAIPWDHLFDDQVNFITDYDDEHSRGFIRNRNPRPSEQAIYVPSSGTANDFFAYSVIAYLPNPSHTGHVLILAGTDSDATAAAAEFLTTEEPMKKLGSLLHAKDAFPCFEALLKVSRVSGTSFQAETVAVRTYPNL
jgi:hypothetical protein